MADVKTLKDVAAELGVSYRAAWHAAHTGKLPAVQPFGSGTTWLVAGNYRDYLVKSHNADAAEQRDDNEMVTK